MSAIEQLLTDHVDIWTAAETEKRSGRGRGAGNATSVYGINKLRELILDLAVRGKLVPQDKHDEPASELLKQIQTEKKKLITETKVKQEKAIAPIVDEDLPFILPQGWNWVRLGEITNFGTTIKLDYIDNDVWVLDLEDIEKDTSKLLRKSRFSERNSLSDKNSFREGDVLYGKLRPYLNKVIVADEDGVCTTEILPLRCYGNFSGNYFKTALKSPYFLQYVNARSYGMKMPRLGTKDGRQAPFPLPPLAEQHRIVAKVDELMALCDQLEARHRDAADAQEQLVSNLLGTLTQSQSATDFSTNWQRIAAHFDTLFATEASVNILRKTILELAVVGRLSHSKESDTPITILLENIMRDRKSLGISKKEEEFLDNEYATSIKTIENNRALLKARFFCDFITKGTTPSPNELLAKGDVPFLKVYNIVGNELDFDYRPIFISNSIHQSKLNRSKIYPGDVIMNIVGPPLGKVAIITNKYPEWNMNQALAAFRPLANIHNRYIFYMLSTESILKSVLAEAKGTAGQDNLSLEQCRDLLIPIPSIEEQYRLVAKVDELMALCEKLRLGITDAGKCQQKLADVLVEHAVTG